MRREIIWRSEDGVGSEYRFLTEGETGIVADGLVIDYPGLFRRAGSG